MSNVASKCKAQTASLRSAMADFDDVSVRRALANIFSNDAKISCAIHLAN
jgi:L-amino acid N-acyltransferase YncA